MGNWSKGPLTICMNFVYCDYNSWWWSWKTKQSSLSWLGRPWLGPAKGHRSYCSTESSVGSYITQKYGLTCAVTTEWKAWKGFEHQQKLLRGLLNFLTWRCSKRSGQSPEHPDIRCLCRAGLEWRFPEALSNLYHPLMPWFERAEEISPHFAPDSNVWGCRIPCAARDRDNIAAIMDFLPKSGARVHGNLASRNIMS